MEKGEHYTVDSRSFWFSIWLDRIKNRREEDDAEIAATNQCRSFNNSLGRAMEELKQKLYTESQKPDRYFKRDLPVSYKFHSCLSTEKVQYLSRKVNEKAQVELKTLVLDPYQGFVRWENTY